MSSPGPTNPRRTSCPGPTSPRNQAVPGQTRKKRHQRRGSYPGSDCHRPTPSTRSGFQLTDTLDRARSSAGAPSGGGGAAARFASLAGEVVEDLFVLLHVGSGLPGRGTEAEQVQYRNSADAVCTLRASHSTFMQVDAYSKTRRATSHDGLVRRFLDLETRDLVVAYLRRSAPSRRPWWRISSARPASRCAGTRPTSFAATAAG